MARINNSSVFLPPTDYRGFYRRVDALQDFFNAEALTMLSQ